MARPVRVRASYVAERARLTRLEEAILRDRRLGDKDRDVALDLVRALTSHLSQIDGKLPLPRRTKHK